jgi:hypothetical protein
MPWFLIFHGKFSPEHDAVYRTELTLPTNCLGLTTCQKKSAALRTFGWGTYRTTKFQKFVIFLFWPFLELVRQNV